MCPSHGVVRDGVEAEEGDMMKGVAVVFDCTFEDGWRSTMNIILIATWDEDGGEVFTDISMSHRSLGCPVHDLMDFDWDEHDDLVGHNLHGVFKERGFDILLAVKEASAPVLQNEGKRYQLFDIARWNRSRSRPSEFISKIRRTAALLKGQHIKVARWALEDARVCHNLFLKVRKDGRVRFYDSKTGKKPFAEVSWVIGDEQGEEE